MQFISGQAKGLNSISKTYLTQVMNMEFAITKMSSKGQVVIPAELRRDIKEGEQLIVIKTKEQIIMKKASKMDKALKEDLEFAERTEQAWKEYERGKFKKMSFDEFLAEARKW
jgi:AbrB family looped-hinge helix DNA binding protein